MKKRENQWRDRFNDILLDVYGQTLFIHKTHGGALGGGGMPDQYYRHPHFGEAWLELKFVATGDTFDWKDQPTRLQRHFLDRLMRAGANSGVLCFFEDKHIAAVRTQRLNEMKWDDYMSWEPAVRDEASLRRLVWGLG